jgi:quinol-cytochrome oxidoreductase complex cytochrome b subunit
MFVEKKATGPRVLPWTSGVVLTLFVFVCGWTGLVMVWDQQGQYLAQIGARLFDTLPIFTEPIQRSFISNAKLPNSFFFLNLFLHVAVPLGVLLLLLIHVWRLATAHFFPTKGAMIGCVVSFVLFSILMPVSLQPTADLSNLTGEVNLDLFYSFWAPAAATMVPAIHLSLWVLVVGIIFTVPWWWHTKTTPNNTEQDKDQSQ